MPTPTPEEDASGPPHRPSVKTAGYLYLIGMVLIGSTTALSTKLAVRELPLPLLPIIRFGTAGLLMLPWALRGGAFQRVLTHSPRRVLASALFCVGLNQFFFLSGTRLAPTTHVGLIYATNPLVVLLIACAIGQERLRRDRVIGIVASVIGVATIGLGNLGSGSDAESLRVLLGDGLLVGAVATWGAYMTVIKPLAGRHGAIPALCASFLVGVLIDLPFCLLLMDWHSATGPLAFQAAWNASPTAWLGLGYLSVIVTVFALAFQNLSLRRFDASEVALFGNAAPILSVVWGNLILGEAVTASLVLGGCLTIGGILWTIRPARFRKPRLPKAAEPAPSAAPCSSAVD